MEEGEGSRWTFFPYGTPYATQQGVMDAVERVGREGGSACELNKVETDDGSERGDAQEERAKVCIVESPTGTGKTLALLSAAVEWLEEEVEGEAEKEEADPVSTIPKSPALPDWLLNAGIPAVEEEDTPLGREAVTPVGPGKQVQALGKGRSTSLVTPDSVASPESPCDYEDANSRKRKGGASSKKTRRIIYASRTHSQLEQVVDELKKLSGLRPDFTCVQLGSRASLCINDDVVKLKHPMRINERCLDMQRAKRKPVAGKDASGLGEGIPGGEDSEGEDGEGSDVPIQNGRATKRKGNKKSGCPCLQNPEKQEAMKTELESTIKDIEELVLAGKKHGACPYYAARNVADTADMILLPYSSLLHRSTRDALGVDLNGAMVIIDEAHNIIEAVESVHSASITSTQLTTVVSQLQTYLNRYCMRLAPENRRRTQTLMALAKAFLGLLSEAPGGRKGKENASNSDQNSKPHIPDGSSLSLDGLKEKRCMTVNDFMFALNIDNINLFQLLRWVKDSKIAFKASTMKVDAADKQISVRDTSSLLSLVSFLTALTHPDEDGRVFVKRCETDGSLKYLLLNGSAHFTELVEQAHSVVLAGGTLQPLDVLHRELMPSLSLQNIIHFSGDHVIESDRLLTLPLRSGPTGKRFELTFASREDCTTIDEIGRVLQNISRVVPNGIIVFFPSYGYLDSCYERWKHNNCLQGIGERKLVFREPRNAADLDSVLQSYTKAALTTGALLMSVVSGKMSEGINFADEMGRCVVVVGLPYANKTDPELLEKIRHLDKREEMSGSWGAAGREYYESSCMKAVNQSIGRAIRHKNDYAAVILLDARYQSGPEATGPVMRLPSWIRKGMPTTTSGAFAMLQSYSSRVFTMTLYKQSERK